MRSILILLFFLVSLTKVYTQTKHKVWKSYDKKIQLTYPVDFTIEENDFQNVLLLKFPKLSNDDKFGEFIALSRKTVGRFAKFEDCVNWRILEIEQEGWKIQKKESFEYNKLKVYEIIYSKNITVEMVKKEILILKNSEWISLCFTSDRTDFESGVMNFNKISGSLKLK